MQRKVLFWAFLFLTVFGLAAGSLSSQRKKLIAQRSLSPSKQVRTQEGANAKLPVNPETTLIVASEKIATTEKLENQVKARYAGFLRFVAWTRCTSYENVLTKGEKANIALFSAAFAKALIQVAALPPPPAQTTPVFLAPEWTFRKRKDDATYNVPYSKDDFFDVLKAVAVISVINPSWIIIPGTIYWGVQTNWNPFDKKFDVYNCAPVFFGGSLQNLHCKTEEWDNPANNEHFVHLKPGHTIDGLKNLGHANNKLDDNTFVLATPHGDLKISVDICHDQGTARKNGVTDADIYFVTTSGGGNLKYSDSPVGPGGYNFLADGAKCAIESNKKGGAELMPIKLDGSAESRWTASTKRWPNAWQPQGPHNLPAFAMTDLTAHISGDPNKMAEYLQDQIQIVNDVRPNAQASGVFPFPYNN